MGNKKEIERFEFLSNLHSLQNFIDSFDKNIDKREIKVFVYDDLRNQIKASYFVDKTDEDRFNEIYSSLGDNLLAFYHFLHNKIYS